MRHSRLGRYRMTLRLGEGSSGVVYRATPIRGTGDYAVKRIRPGLIEEPRFVDALLAEARISGHLDHPGIARLYEVGQARGECFLVMEYVEGMSLKELLARLAAQERTMPPGVACHLAENLARVLGYAHSRCDEQGQPLGIVHRDVNPANIMVTPAGQPKLLDFGIASAAGHVRGAGMGTSTGIIKGTFGYLSPEQAEGVPLDGRSDLFSLGVVLYECLTGKRLFDGPNPLQTLQLLRESAFPPPAAVEALDPELQRVLRLLLARRPEDRPGSGEAAAEALGRLARRLEGDAESLARLLAELPAHPGSAAAPDGETSGGTRAFVSGWRRRRPASVVALVLGVVLAVPAAWFAVQRAREGRSGERPSDRPPDVVGRRWFAALGFRNLTGRPEMDWLSTGLAAIVGAQLGQGDRLRSLHEAEVERTRRELGLQPADELPGEVLDKIRRTANADLVLLGSYAVDGGSLRIDLRVQETGRGQTVARADGSGQESDFYGIATRAADRLHLQLDRTFAPRTGTPNPSRAALPAGVQAARLYSEGLARLQVGDSAAARDLLQAAAAAAPDHALTHLALSRALSLLGFEGQARLQASRALALAAPLPLEQRLQVEAHSHQSNDRFVEATAAYQRLFDLFPDNLDYGLQLAEAHRSRQDALAVLERLRKLPAPLGDDPRIDLALAQYAGDAPTRLRAAQAARQKAEARGAALLVADAQVAEADAYQAQRQCSRAIELARSARGAYQRAGAWKKVATSGNQVGSCLNDQGDDLGALAMADENLAIGERIGDRRLTLRMLTNGAFTLSRLGRREEARLRYQRALAIATEIEDQDEVCDMRTRLARTIAEDGDLVAGIAASDQAVEASRRHCDRELPFSLSDAAEFRSHAGQLEEAARLTREAKDVAGRRNHRPTLIAALLTEAWHLRIADRLRQAQAPIAQAKAMIEGPQLIVQGRLVDQAAARVALERGNAALAETLTRQLLGRLRHEPRASPDETSAARLLLARALLARGRVAGARQEIDRALAEGNPPRWQQVELDITRARIEARQGRSGAARKRLDDLVRSCRQQGLFALELEARLAALEIGPRGRALARALSSEAARRGFALVARRAATLAGTARPPRRVAPSSSEG